MVRRAAAAAFSEVKIARLSGLSRTTVRSILGKR
ncbi:hypothetical protein GKJPGBOP_01991 [Streptomyces paromomycinus]|uniref:Uncharacterized protein n=1 Tax=Streptomyces paromomycinus TaxID=92743 RepID=A0A401VZ56_STREY|nr:hypothetical protein GKJPGBOP_01991 [Streptomyces paromomycinus]